MALSIFRTACLQLNIQALIPIGLLSFHQSSSNGLKRWTFTFLDSRTIPTPQPQRLLTHRALTNSILLAPLHTLNFPGVDFHLPTSNWGCPFPISLLQETGYYCTTDIGRFQVEVEVTLQLTVDQSVSMFWCRAYSGICDLMLLPVGRLLSETCSLVSVWRPLWREDGSALCSSITQWSESRRTRNHTLLSQIRLLQPGGPDSRIYIPQEQDGPVILPGTGFPIRRFLRLARLRWRYSNPLSISLDSSYITTDGQSANLSWC
jgi:hypothetical protein